MKSYCEDALRQFAVVAGNAHFNEEINEDNVKVNEYQNGIVF